MDYNNGDFLAAWQWKVINEPPFVWNFLEGDESGFSKSIIPCSDVLYKLNDNVNDNANTFQDLLSELMVEARNKRRLTAVMKENDQYDDNQAKRYHHSIPIEGTIQDAKNSFNCDGWYPARNCEGLNTVAAFMSVPEGGFTDAQMIDLLRNYIGGVSLKTLYLVGTSFPMPVVGVPASSEMMVRFRAPRATSASIRISGTPLDMKPPTMTHMPSFTSSAAC